MLPNNSTWWLVDEPAFGDEIEGIFALRSLRFHLSCLTIGVLVAKKFHVTNLAFGFAHYQSNWNEQTREAVDVLDATLRHHQLNLVLPVWDLRGKKDAMEILEGYGISTEALEQKSDIRNTNLSESEQKYELNIWKNCVDAVLRNCNFCDLDIVDNMYIQGGEWRNRGNE